MTDLSDQIVASARGYIGTRFRHQGRRKACGSDRGGVDCLGLLVCVAKECTLMHNNMPIYARDRRDYGHIPDKIRLISALNECLSSICLDDVQKGDVLLLNMDRNPQHLAIVGNVNGDMSLIHAYAPARGVVEHRLDASWRKKIESVYRFQTS